MKRHTCIKLNLEIPSEPQNNMSEVKEQLADLSHRSELWNANK